MSAAPPFATVNGQRVTGARVCVPNVGAWFADLDLEAKSALTGKVETKLGALSLIGLVAIGYSGSFGLGSKLRILGGAGAWAKSVPPKHYHNDAGVKASTVLADAARAAGETINIPTTLDRVGIDFVRRMGPASRVLEQVAPSWWVDYAGVTQLGERAATEVQGQYEVLVFDQRSNVATIAADDLRVIQIGSVLRQRLDAPATVRELEIVMSGSEVRLYAWCGGEASAHSRIGRGLRAIARQTDVAKIFGSYRYRVVQMSSDPDRVELQAVRKAAGLPDVLPLSLFPGMAGLWAKLAPGAVVLVTFIEGDASAPIVTHFTPKGQPGFLPIELVLDASGSVKLGEHATSVAVAGGVLAAARQTDPVQAGPFTGAITGPCSPKVTVG
jgi:hypothetical protein